MNLFPLARDHHYPGSSKFTVPSGTQLHERDVRWPGAGCALCDDNGAANVERSTEGERRGAVCGDRAGCGRVA